MAHHSCALHIYVKYFSGQEVKFSAVIRVELIFADICLCLRVNFIRYFMLLGSNIRIVHAKYALQGNGLNHAVI